MVLKTGVYALVALSILLTACGPRPDAPILLFNGTGTSPNDVTAIGNLLRQRGVPYATAGTWRLNRMTQADLLRYRLLIVPGGNFVQIGNGLSGGASSSIRGAVENGLHYLGICAGAFFAGNSPYNGLNLTAGVRFAFYSAEAQGIRKAAIPILTADGAVLDQYWEDGPQLNGWGDAVARYPDGSAATVQGRAGAGWVVLTGFHPEAPESWRRGLIFRTPVSQDQDYAAELVQSALSGTPLRVLD